MPAFPYLAVLTLLATTLGCGAGGASHGGAADSRPSAGEAAADTGKTPETVVRELAALDGRVTPALWLERHPGDSLAPFHQREAPAPGESGAPWCMTAERSWRDGAGRTVTRVALFYAPQPTEPLEPLPPAFDPRLARTQCHLGFIRVSAAAASPALVEALADSVRDALATRYRRAAERGDPVRQYSRSAHWRAPARWRASPVTVVAAADSGPFVDPPLTAFAFAYLPASGVGPRDEADDRTRSDDEDWVGSDTALSSAALRLGIAAANAPADVGVALRVAAERAAMLRGEAGPDRAAVDSALVSALREWLAVTASYPPERRAAALLAADRVLALVRPGADVPGSPSDSGAVVRALTALGAEHVYDQLGAAFVYSGNWIRAAQTLDPTGQVGELAVLVQLDAGFGEPLCGGPNEGEWFRTVIAEGERYLRAPHDRAHTVRAHLLVADAYRDIVALANGAVSDYADAARYRPDESSARARAVEHYRAAIALDPSPGAGDRRRAWREAWRLLAGLAPSDQVRFFCVYD